MKDKLIRMTGRETLTYKFIDYLQFKWLSFLTKIHIGSNSHIKKEIKYYYQTLSKSWERALHLGCGSNYFYAFLNSDVIQEDRSWASADIYLDITKPFHKDLKDFQTIYSNHLIEHIYRIEALPHLKECYKILKTGGELIIGTPDLAKMATLFTKKPIKELVELHEKYTLEDKFFPGVYINEMSHILYGHKFLYDFNYLEYLLKKAGFKTVKRVNNKKTGNEHIDVYLKQHMEKHTDYVTMTVVATK